MRLESAALFAVGFLSVSFWLHGSARCQSSPAPPLSLAAPPSVTGQGSPPAATCHWGGLNLWCNTPAGSSASSPRPTAKGSPPPAAKNISPPMATDDVPSHAATAKGSPPPTAKNVSPSMATDVPPRTAIVKGSARSAAKDVSPPMATDNVPPRTAIAKGSARSAAARNSPPPANAKEAPALAIHNPLPPPGIDNISPTPRIGNRSPSQEEPAADYDGLTAGVEDGEETGQTLPTKPRPAKRSKVGQKSDVAKGSSAKQPLDDQAEVEKLKPYLTICRGC